VRGHRFTRTANIRAEVKVWADSTGRITRATVANSTGNAALDTALRDEVLTGLQLSEPPPQGMPMPIVLRVTARRPR
jgi:protein TonB